MKLQFTNINASLEEYALFLDLEEVKDPIPFNEFRQAFTDQEWMDLIQVIGMPDESMPTYKAVLHQTTFYMLCGAQTYVCYNKPLEPR